MIIQIIVDFEDIHPPKIIQMVELLTCSYYELLICVLVKDKQTFFLAFLVLNGNGNIN